MMDEYTFNFDVNSIFLRKDRTILTHELYKCGANSLYEKIRIQDLATNDEIIICKCADNSVALYEVYHVNSMDGIYEVETVDDEKVLVSAPRDTVVYRFISREELVSLETQEYLISMKRNVDEQIENLKVQMDAIEFGLYKLREKM
jgi:hypothetical protein